MWKRIKYGTNTREAILLLYSHWSDYIEKMVFYFGCCIFNRNTVNPELIQKSASQLTKGVETIP